MKVIKRDGRIKNFNYERIEEAVKKAYEEVYESLKEFNQDKNKIYELVIYALKELQQPEVTIENIQDIVINALKIVNPVICKAYSDYRKEREEIRIKNSKKEQFYKEILQCMNVDNDNANVNQYSFSGRKYRIADNEQKEYALRNLISKEGRESFESGLIYYHDLNSYAIGDHNCLFADIDRLLANGFSTRNGDVRPANSYSTACQLIAVIFQCQSQVQYGGIASNHLDFSLAPYVAKSFKKLFKEGYYEKYGTICNIDDKEIKLGNSTLEKNYYYAYDYAVRHLEREGKQATEGLYHNLNTLESRAGSQLPFTSINLGRDTSPEGRLVNKWVFNASLFGIGKYNRTSIFPISIFQYKKGVNAKKGEPNYAIKKLALKSLSRRIYPNVVNGDFKANIEDPNNPDTFMATMGCRTMLGYDVNSDSYIKTGRGNISPITIILPKLGLDYGIALGKREKADIEGFMRELDKTLELVKDELIIRYNYIANQSPKSAPFMYDNLMAMESENCKDTVRPCIQHGTNAIGLLGMAECCIAMFGKHHGESVEAYQFALKVIRHMFNYCKEQTQKNKINFSLYFTPAENLCKTAMKTLKLHYGVVKGVTDRLYLTNSIHIPVWYQLDAYSKLVLEAPFTQYGTGGCITYIELDTDTMKNLTGLEKLVDFAMDLNIPYLAINFPIDTCNDCGYSSKITEDKCPICGSNKIERLRRVTGYITVDYHAFNEGKIAEVEDRVVHNIYNPQVKSVLKQAYKELKDMGIIDYEIQ